jgi:hypothetical protein
VNRPSGAARKGGGNDGDHRRVAGPERPTPGSVGSVDGPVRFFAGHPMVYGLALAGAGGTALYALTVAALCWQPNAPGTGSGRRRHDHPGCRKTTQ